MNIERGKAVFTRLTRKQTGSEPHAMYRNDIGWIGVDAGESGNPDNDYKGGHGIAHILAKHKGAERQLADVIQNGEAFHHESKDAEHPNYRKISIVKGDVVVIVSKYRDGHTLITGFCPDSTSTPTQPVTERGNRERGATGEGDNSSCATLLVPTSDSSPQGSALNSTQFTTPTE